MMVPAIWRQPKMGLTHGSFSSCGHGLERVHENYEESVHAAGAQLATRAASHLLRHAHHFKAKIDVAIGDAADESCCRCPCL